MRSVRSRCLLLLALSACNSNGSPAVDVVVVVDSALPQEAAVLDQAVDAPARHAERVLVDRTDEVSGKQIHAMYVLPADGADEKLDTSGAVATSVAAFNSWLAARAGGSRLRLDTHQGTLDVTFFRLAGSDAEISAKGAYVRDAIEQELEAAGFDDPDKVYAVFYGGSSTWACGGGAWPPTLPGSVAAIYLKGTPPNATPCAENPLAPSPASPGYFELALLHEILHTLGFVAECAPNHTLAGHVSDDPADLMYAGNQAWVPDKLDVGGDDYYGHGKAGCLDLAQSPFLE